MIFPLKELRIDNFRGIRQATIILDPRVTVFFGSNAAGKTTVLDALAIALGALVSRVPKVAGRGFARSGDVRVPWIDRDEVSERRGVERPFCRVQVFPANGAFWDVTRLRSAQDKRRQPDSFGRTRLHSWLDPVVREALEAAPGELTAPIPLVASYGNERAVVEVPLRQRGFRRSFERFEGLDQALRATTRFKAVFEWFRVMEDEERRERERRRDFDYRLPELEWVRRAVETAELRCKNPRVETGPLRMLVDFEHAPGLTETLDISSLSDGYRTHFALIVDLARRMVQLNPSGDLDDLWRGTNTPAVVAIDEVDLHLDPEWQGRVIDGLLRTFPNAQFVVSTHSEQVIGAVAASCVRRLRWRDGEITVGGVPYAQGATSERILVGLMGAPERVAGPTTSKLEAYVRLVSAGEGGTDRAVALRVELDNELGYDSALHRADLEIQRQELTRRMIAERK